MTFIMENPKFVDIDVSNLYTVYFDIDQKKFFVTNLKTGNVSNKFDFKQFYTLFYNFLKGEKQFDQRTSLPTDTKGKMNVAMDKLLPSKFRPIFQIGPSGSIEGYIRYRITEDNMGVISELFTNPENQRQGVASKLCQTVINVFIKKYKLKKITVNCMNKNFNGHKFYQAIGFKPIGLSGEAIDYDKALQDMQIRKNPCKMQIGENGLRCKNAGSTRFCPCNNYKPSYTEDDILEQQVDDGMDINSTENLYSVEEDKNDSENFSEKNESHNNENNKHRQAAEATQKKKGGFFKKLKELPAKANHIKQRARLWTTKMGHFAFYKKYLDRLESGLYDKCASEAPIYENRMKGDPVQILKNEAQTYIRDIVHDMNGLYHEVLKLSDNLKDKVTAEQCIGVIKDYCSEYASDTDAHGSRIDRDKMGWNKKLLDATKFKIAKILLRNGQHKVYGYTMRSMVQKGYPKPNYLIVCLFVENPEERPDQQVVSDIFSGPPSFEILADADKKDIFNVSAMTEAVLSKTVDNNIINEIKLSRSNALNMFKAREMPNKKDEAKIIDQIWDGIKDASKELLSRKAYLIDCINVYFDMILRIDKLAYNSMKSMLEKEAEKLDSKYKNQSAFDRAKNTHTRDSDGNRVTKTERQIQQQQAYRENGRSTNSEGKVKAKEVKDITKALNKSGTFH